MDVNTSVQNHKGPPEEGLPLRSGPGLGTSAVAVDPRRAYDTASGVMYQATIEQLLESPIGESLSGKVQLIFTSPPYPLRTKKRYGNLIGDAYVAWLSGLATAFRELLTPNGSIVIEMGNAWTKGQPVMAVLGLRALLGFLERGTLHLCQQFVCENPARLPGPAQWVNVERIRVKDAFSHVWWMAPTARPKADNKKVLRAYSKAMRKLLARRTYNAGERPSEHNVNPQTFLIEHGGSIPSNVLRFANTNSQDQYFRYCRAQGIAPHPSRMPSGLADFFIKLLTDEDDLILDPFAGSNTTGASAERLRRRWISVEPKADYIRGSVGRFPEPRPSLRELQPDPPQQRARRRNPPAAVLENEQPPRH